MAEDRPNENTAALQRYGLIPDVGADIGLVAHLDEAGGPPSSTTYVGRVATTDAFIGIRVFDQARVQAFIYGDTAAGVSVREWAAAEVVGDGFRAESGDKPLTSEGEVVVTGRRDAFGISGEVTLPDGAVASYRADRASGRALLLRLEAEVDPRVLDRDEQIGEFGVVRDDPDAPEEPLPGPLREVDTIANAWIRLPDGEVRGGCVCSGGYWWCQCQHGHWHRGGTC